MLRLTNIEKEKYDEFVATHKKKSHFLQSLSWGELALAKKNLTPHYLGLIDDKDNVVASALLLEKKLPLKKTYFYSNYRGEWFVMFKHRVPFDTLFPTGDRELNLLEMENELAPYKVGDAVAQVKFNRVEQATWIEVQELEDTSRGADGGLNREGK